MSAMPIRMNSVTGNEEITRQRTLQATRPVKKEKKSTSVRSVVHPGARRLGTVACLYFQSVGLLLLTIEDNFCEDLSRLRVDVEELLPFISGRVDNGVRDLQNRAKTSSYHKFTSSQSTVKKKSIQINLIRYLQDQINTVLQIRLTKLQSKKKRYSKHTGQNFKEMKAFF